MVAFPSKMDQGYLPREVVRRARYPGGALNGEYEVTGFSIAPYKEGEGPNTLDVFDFKEYSSGCKVHAGCFGHMCKTRDGTMLPPQSISVRIGAISTQFLQASMSAFFGDHATYLKRLTETCLTKHGHLRATMSSPVAGSLRLIAVPQTVYPMEVVCISETLATSTKFERVRVFPDGSISKTSSFDILREGDYCLLNRPPTLTLRSIQPVRIKYWEHHALGIHPELFTQLHGDYDGDEAHLFPLGEPESIQEAMSWVHSRLPQFERARRKQEELGIREHPPSTGGLGFMRYTTLSTKELIDGVPSLVFGEETRNPEKHLKGIHKRFVDSTTSSRFVKESIRGTGDVMRQQLSQSSIGDLSRIARIAASCFTRDNERKLVCATRRGPITLDNTTVPDEGVPSCKAIMKICSVAQQALLDAHRAGVSQNTGIDLVANMLRGAQTGREELDDMTLCAFSLDVTFLPKTIWTLETKDHLLCVIKLDSIDKSNLEKCEGSYSPSVLKHIPPDRRVQVCRLGIRYVCHYHEVELTEGEEIDLAWCLSYKPEVSKHPVTTREGMLARELSPLDTLLATDFNKTPRLTNGITTPITSTSAMFLGNFEEFKRRRVLQS